MEQIADDPVRKGILAGLPTILFWLLCLLVGFAGAGTVTGLFVATAGLFNAPALRGLVAPVYFLFVAAATLLGAVAICVGIYFGAISRG